MAKDSVTLEKSKEFAIRIVRLYQYLYNERKEYVLSKQILKSGTSIGANLSEALYGITKKDFLSKVYISLKECAETLYWLELLYKTSYITESEFDSLNKDCTELVKLFTSIAKTTSSNLISNL
ncbi:MAG: four helix bundle protein [Muribaculaceae bacterium]|nr:four helix bundle protein [Muribaculaceae bacterium]